MPVLGKFLGPLNPGTVSFLNSAHPYVFEIASMLCVQVVQQLGREVLFIDGGNSFEPYRLMTYARRLGADRDRVLDYVRVARAFTAYQMTTLLTDMLPREIERIRPGAVVVACLPDLYDDQDVRRSEARSMLDLCVRVIRRVTSENELITAITNHGLSKLGGQSPLMRALQKNIDIQLRIERRGGGEGRARFHPAFSRGRLDQGSMRLVLTRSGEKKWMNFCSAPRYQRTLDEFRGPGGRM
jgi:hypothetical protein